MLTMLPSIRPCYGTFMPLVEGEGIGEELQPILLNTCQFVEVTGTDSKDATTLNCIKQAKVHAAEKYCSISQGREKPTEPQYVYVQTTIKVMDAYISKGPSFNSPIVELGMGAVIQTATFNRCNVVKVTGTGPCYSAYIQSVKEQFIDPISQPDFFNRCDVIELSGTDTQNAPCVVNQTDYTVDMAKNQAKLPMMAAELKDGKETNFAVVRTEVPEAAALTTDEFLTGIHKPDIPNSVYQYGSHAYVLTVRANSARFDKVCAVSHTSEGLHCAAVHAANSESNLMTRIYVISDVQELDLVETWTELPLKQACSICQPQADQLGMRNFDNIRFSPTTVMKRKPKEDVTIRSSTSIAAKPDTRDVFEWNSACAALTNHNSSRPVLCGLPEVSVVDFRASKAGSCAKVAQGSTAASGDCPINESAEPYHHPSPMNPQPRRKRHGKRAGWLLRNLLCFCVSGSGDSNDE